MKHLLSCFFLFSSLQAKEIEIFFSDPMLKPQTISVPKGHKLKLSEATMQSPVSSRRYILSFPSECNVLHTTNQEREITSSTLPSSGYLIVEGKLHKNKLPKGSISLHGGGGIVLVDELTIMETKKN